MACQTLTHQTPSYMTPRVVEVAPNDVLWQNLSLPWWNRHLRNAIVFLVSLALVALFIPYICAQSIGFTQKNDSCVCVCPKLERHCDITYPASSGSSDQSLDLSPWCSLAPSRQTERVCDQDASRNNGAKVLFCLCTSSILPRHYLGRCCNSTCWLPC
jgi:hypothetical protein